MRAKSTQVFSETIDFSGVSCCVQIAQEWGKSASPAVHLQAANGLHNNTIGN
jgi:hypothetical protein